MQLISERVNLSINHSYYTFTLQYSSGKQSLPYPKTLEQKKVTKTDQEIRGKTNELFT